MSSIHIFLLFCAICNAFASDKVRNASDFLRHSNHNDPRPPIVLIPGMCASRMIAWKQKKCVASTIEIEDVVWLNLQKMVETMTYDKRCWLDCMKLGVNGSDPSDCKLRPDEGLSAIGELSPGNVFTPPGTSVFTNLIRTMSRELGYDSNNIIGAPYDWRLAPSQLEKRDSYFSTLKFRIESSVERHGRPAIVIAYSMGNNLFQYFMEWLRVVNRPAMGYNAWMRRYIWSYVGISAPLLGASPPVKSVLSGHTFGLPINEAQARDLLLTCPSTHYLNPRSATPLNGSSDNHKHARISENELKYIKPIVTIKGLKSLDTTYNKSFGIEDVESGELFRWIGEHYKDSHLTNKFKDLVDLYDSDPVQPLRLTYRRPPVKHVLMLYGVDLPTEVAYSYQIQNTTSSFSPANGASAGGNGNAAPSAIPSSVVNGVTDWLNMLAEITGHPKINSTAVPNTATSTTGTTSSSVYSDYLSNPLVLDETFFEDSGCHIVNHKKSATSNAELSMLPLPVATKLQQQQQPLLSGGGVSDPSSTSASITASPPASTKPIETTCRSEVYAVKTVGNPIEFITNGGPILKRYVISNADSGKPSDPTSDYLNVAGQKHSGDTTVPYVSLSHAKTWLREESLGCEFNWVPPTDETSHNDGTSHNAEESEDLVAAVLAMQERVMELNRKLKIVDEEEQLLSNEVDGSSSDESILSGSVSSDGSAKVASARKLLNKFTNVITTPSLVTDKVSSDPETRAESIHPTCSGTSKQWHEKIPSRLHKHFLDDWGAPVTMTAAISNFDPATESFYTQHANGDSTAVIEVSGLDHLEIVKHAYVHEVMFRHLLSKMTEDLFLEN